MLMKAEEMPVRSYTGAMVINMRDAFDLIGHSSGRRKSFPEKTTVYTPSKNRMDPADGRYWD